MLARVSARVPGFTAHWGNSMRLLPEQWVTFHGDSGLIRLTAPLRRRPLRRAAGGIARPTRRHQYPFLAWRRSVRPASRGLRYRRPGRGGVGLDAGGCARHAGRPSTWPMPRLARDRPPDTARGAPGKLNPALIRGADPASPHFRITQGRGDQQFLALGPAHLSDAERITPSRRRPRPLSPRRSPRSRSLPPPRRPRRAGPTGRRCWRSRSRGRWSAPRPRAA